MKTIYLVQGSPAWHEHRSQHFNASDCPVMMGLSKYKSRDQLLAETATGIKQEFDAATEKRFADGHRFEALARPLAEAIIGEDLFPVTGTKGLFSASFDGLTLDETICFEHKSLNAELASVIGVTDLPICYRIQMEQQLYVSGADKCLFMASKWTDEGDLVEEKHVWYFPDLDLREQITNGWAQFTIDLTNYKPVEVVTEMPKAEVVIELPALFIHAKGEITDSNMKAYGEALTKKLAEVRAIVLVDDQDFANAKAAAATFRDQIKKNNAAVDAMLAQTVTVGEAARMIEAWNKDLQQTALQLEKDVEREDLAKKRAMVNQAGLDWTAHVEALEVETKPIRLNITSPVFAEAIKKKRNYASMQSALNDELAAGKILADATAKDIRTKLAWCKETSAGFGFLFADMDVVICKPLEDFQLVVTSRIEAHKKAEADKVEAQRVAMQEAADAKAKTEADAILAAERAKAEAEQQALVAAGVKAQLEAQVKAATAARNAAPNKLVGEAIEQAMKDAITTGTGIIKTDGQKVEAISPETFILKHGTKVIEVKPRAGYVINPHSASIPGTRPNRAELIDAISSHFGTTNETALEWLLDEFDPKVYAGQQKAKEAV